VRVFDPFSGPFGMTLCGRGVTPGAAVGFLARTSTAIKYAFRFYRVKIPLVPTERGTYGCHRWMPRVGPQLPRGNILFLARLGKVEGPCACTVALTAERSRFALPPVFLGAACEGSRLRPRPAFRIISEPMHSIELHVFGRLSDSVQSVSLTLVEVGPVAFLLYASLYFPRIVLQSFRLALAGQRRLARLRLAYMVQGRSRSISYSSWCALFEGHASRSQQRPIASGRQCAIALVVLGKVGSQATADTLETVNGQCRRPARIVTCNDTLDEFRSTIATLRDDPFVTHVAVVLAGDKLATDAVAELVVCLSKTKVDAAYADHDWIKKDGKRCAPCFKPVWNEPLAMTTDLLTGLTVMAKAWLTSGDIGVERLSPIAAWREIFVSAASRDGARIAHISRILCHCSERSAHHQPIEESCATLRRCGTAPHYPGRIVTCPKSYIWPSVCVIIPSACRPGIADRCLSRVLANTDYNNDVEFVIVVHKSRLTEPRAASLLQELRRDTRVRILVHEVDPFNYAAVNNQAANSTRTELICLLNDDVEPLHPGWLKLMVGQLNNPTVGAVGARLLYRDRSLQHMGLVIGMMGTAEHWQRFARYEEAGYAQRACLTQDVSAVTGACLLVRRCAYSAIGGLDEAFAISFNDVDFCLRLRKADWRIVACAEAELFHDETSSFGASANPAREHIVAAELRSFRSRWQQVLLDDPHFNPHLSLETTQWSLAVPPRDRRTRMAVVRLPQKVPEE
jgi:O-antigen biosynthesis protein